MAPFYLSMQLKITSENLNCYLLNIKLPLGVGTWSGTLLNKWFLEQICGKFAHNMITLLLRLCPNKHIVTWLVTSGPLATLEPTVRCSFAQIHQFSVWICILRRGEDGLGRHLVPPPPPKQGNSPFCLSLLTYMTSGLFFWCYLFLFMQPIFLILTQPSWDGYFWLFSPKISIRGRIMLLMRCCITASGS